MESTKILLVESDEENSPEQQESGRSSTAVSEGEGQNGGQKGEATLDQSDPLHQSIEFTQGEVDDLKEENLHLKHVL